MNFGFGFAYPLRFAFDARLFERLLGEKLMNFNFGKERNYSVLIVIKKFSNRRLSSLVK